MEAQIWKISLRDYHADVSRDSSSSLRLFERSPLAYYRQRIAKSAKSEYSDSTRIGSAVHAILGGDFAEQCVVLPPGPYRTNEAKARRDECMAANRNKCWLTPEEHDLASAMTKSIMRHELASAWVTAPGENELTIKWDDVLPLKVRFDRLLDDGTIIEYKTMTFGKGDPLQSFRKDAKDYGYDLQAALYSRGRGALLKSAAIRGDSHKPIRGGLRFAVEPGLEPTEMETRYIVVDSQPPHDCFVARAAPDYLRGGEQRLAAVLAGLAAKMSRESFAPGEHNWIPDGYGGVAELHAF